MVLEGFDRFSEHFDQVATPQRGTRGRSEWFWRVLIVSVSILIRSRHHSEVPEVGLSGFGGF